LLRAVIRWFLNFGSGWWPRFLGGLALVGFAYAMATKRWLLPVWIVLLFLIISDTDRFHIILSGLLIAELLVDVSRSDHIQSTWERKAGGESVVGIAFLTLVIGTILIIGFRGIQWTQVYLSRELVDVAQWLTWNTHKEDRYLFLSEGNSSAEWLPYLTSRTPGIGIWGSEWTNDYERQVWLQGEMDMCVRDQRFQCVINLFPEIGSNLDLIIVPASSEQLLSQISTKPEWKKAYANQGFVVYRVPK
jgi:hypothetical protein